MEIASRVMSTHLFFEESSDRKADNILNILLELRSFRG